MKENLTNSFFFWKWKSHQWNYRNKKIPPINTPPSKKNPKTKQTPDLCLTFIFFTEQLINVGDLNKLPLHSMKTIKLPSQALEPLLVGPIPGAQDTEQSL